MTNTTKLILYGGILLLAVGVTVILLAVFLTKENQKTGCEFYPFEVDLHPLVIISGTSDFIYPKHGEKLIKFTNGQNVDFICPGRTVISGESEISKSVLTGTCLSGSRFKISSAEVDWKELKCSDYAWSTIRYTGKSCENNGNEIEVGFDTGDNRFLRFLLICFNQQLQIAYYSYINLTASINQRVRNTPRPSFLQASNIYNIGTVDNLYKRKTQRATINKLLALSSDSTKYIKDATDFFLSRGHLTANSDGFYAAQQNATFYFPNIAPQWQTFNGFNWNQVEIDVRDYAEKNAVDLQVWTGVYGVATLPHEQTKEPTELYLFVDETTNRKALPVPEIYWKVAYNPLNGRGIALIGVNNPYNSTLTTICDDVSQKLTWLNCDRNNQQKGFIYACSIETFRKVVTSMPNVSDRGLML